MTNIEPCPGWDGHAWTLSIEEGKILVYSPPCGPDCNLFTKGPDGTMHSRGLGDAEEYLTMCEMPILVRMATECPAYDVDTDNVPTGPPRRMGGYESGSHYIAHGTFCDCNWWPVLIPTSSQHTPLVGQLPPVPERSDINDATGDGSHVKGGRLADGGPGAPSGKWAPPATDTGSKS